MSEERIDFLEERIDKLEKKIDNSFLIRKDIEVVEENEEFLEEEEWIKEKKREFEGDIIAFTKKKGNLKLLAHSKEREKLLKKIDNMLENQKISEHDPILFR